MVDARELNKFAVGNPLSEVAPMFGTGERIAFLMQNQGGHRDR